MSGARSATAVWRRSRLSGCQAGEKRAGRRGILTQGDITMQHQPQHGPAAAPAPLQTRQRQAALLRFKRIQAADTQILPADLA